MSASWLNLLCLCFCLFQMSNCFPVDNSANPKPPSDTVEGLSEISKAGGGSRTADSAAAKIESLSEDPKESPPKGANPIQDFLLNLGNLGRNTSSSSGNPMQDLQNWFSGLSGTSDVNNPLSAVLGGAQNSPMMILGSYQAVKMPIPQLGDVIKGLGGLGGAAQGLNQLVGGLQG